MAKDNKMEHPIHRPMSVKKATLINGAGRYSNIVLSFVVNIILSRILSPEEFGIVAVVTIFTTFFTIFADMGFGSAYIESRELLDKDRNSLFTFMCYVGFILFAMFFGFAYFIAWFYENDIFIIICWLLGLNLLFTACKAIPLSDLQRQHRFAVVSIVQFCSSVVAASVAIAMGFLGFSYYSIIVQSILYTFINFIIFEIVTKCKFVLKIDFSVIKKTYKFALGQLGFNFINYFSRNVDNLLISKFLGEQSLGYYDKAYKTSTYPVSNFASIIGGSIHPVLAKYQDDKELIYREFVKTFLFLFGIGSFVSVFLYFASKETILILYGEQREQSIFPFSMLALSLAFQMSLNITGAFYQVLNRTFLLAVEGLISMILIVSGIVVGITQQSIEFVALGFLIGETFNFAQSIFVLRFFLFKRSFKEVWIHGGKLFMIWMLTFGLSFIIFSFWKVENIYLFFFIKFGVILSLFVFLVFVFQEHRVFTDILFKKQKLEYNLLQEKPCDPAEKKEKNIQ